MISVMEFVFFLRHVLMKYAFLLSQICMSCYLFYLYFICFIVYMVFLFLSNFHFDCPLFEHDHMPRKCKVTCTRKKQSLHIFLIGNQSGL